MSAKFNGERDYNVIIANDFCVYIRYIALVAKVNSP